jgi:hypothetical protein
MTQVETVAFWVAFIGSIVGIVLSIVAIVFSILVDRRSSKVSDHLIQSLQKIESAVERSSSDTRELIKAGWDKMLGNVDKGTVPPSGELAAKEVAAGIAAELRSELKGLATGKDSPAEPQLQLKKLEEYLKSLEASLVAQLKAARLETRPSAKFESVLETMTELTQPSYALLRAITNRHLTQSEYKLLLAGRLGASVLELRRNGLLVPVVSHDPRSAGPCYYFPSPHARIIRAALQVLPPPPEELQEDVAKDLKSIGYRYAGNSTNLDALEHDSPGPVSGKS